MAEFSLWVGIDLGHKVHQVCVLDHQRRVILESSVSHEGGALNKLADELVKLARGAPRRIAVSTETTSGAVISTLLERKVAVFSINPKQLDRFRDRHTLAGAKDDRRDALVLADSLRTDTHLFQRLRIGDAKLVELRELLRILQNLKRELGIHSNQLSEQLHRYYPQVLRLGSVHSDRWLWDLLELTPLPEDAQKLSRSKVEKILKRHRIRKVTAEQIIEALRSPPLHVAPGVNTACVRHIMLLIPKLRMDHRSRLDCEKDIQKILSQLCLPIVDDEGKTYHSDAAILMSIPGVGVFVAATMLGEASQLIAERDLYRLRAQCGTAPVTKQSGSNRYVIRRLSRNPRLQDAVYHWARRSAQIDPRAQQHYERLRAAGHRHGRALRGVGDRLLAVLITMLRKRELFDQSRSRPVD